MSADSLARESAERLFSADLASRSLGIALLEIGPGMARMTMTVRSDMINGHGVCHGGYIFALADSAFAFACNSHGEPAVGAAVAIDFLAPARLGDVLTASAREVWLRGRTGLYDLCVSRADDEVIAHARGRSHRSKPPAKVEPR